MARPIATGLLVALGTAIVWALLSAVLGFHVGLLVVAAFGGWLIGSAVRPAAVEIGRSAAWVAAVLGALAWLVGSFLDFVLSQILLPSPSTALAERLTPAAYIAYAGATFDVIEVISLALLVIVAWRSAR